MSDQKKEIDQVIAEVFEQVNERVKSIGDFSDFVLSELKKERDKEDGFSKRYLALIDASHILLNCRQEYSLKLIEIGKESIK